MKIAKIFLLAIYTLIIPSMMYSQTKAEKIDELMSKYHEYGLFNGTMLVGEDGKVIIKKGYGFANMEWQIPNNPDTKFRIGSISKQFTAAVILQLIEEGKIKLDGKISDYIPYYRKDTGEKVTIYHLLTHTSGIQSYTSMPYVWTDSLRNHYEQEYFVKHFHSNDLEFEPGNNFTYNNTGYYLLAVIAERVTGKKFGDLLEERIFRPAGMTSTGSEDDEIPVTNKASGYLKNFPSYSLDPYMYMPNVMGAGHMYSTVEDMLKWDQVLYSEKILSEESKKLMCTPFLANYGFGVGVVRIPNFIQGKDSLTLHSHTGGINGFNTIFTRLIENKQCLVIFSNAGDAPLNDMSQQIGRILYGLEPQYPRIPISTYLVKVIDDEGIESGIESYKRCKADEAGTFDFSETELNKLGYYYLRQGKTDFAVDIFKLNVEAFPEASNTYDSYGEALLKSGNKEGAIANYKKSLELNPANLNAKKILADLGVEIEDEEVVVPAEILRTYTGKYELFENFIITISVEGNQLFAQASGQPRIEIFPLNESSFYYKVVNARINFLKNESNVVDKLILFQNGQEMPAKKIE